MKTLRWKWLRPWSLVLGVLLAHAAIAAPAAAVARTPPMGWNSWNHFGGHVTGADVRAAADALVSSGMAAAGYRYVTLDLEGFRSGNLSATALDRDQAQAS